MLNTPTKNIQKIYGSFSRFKNINGPVSTTFEMGAAMLSETSASPNTSHT